MADLLARWLNEEVGLSKVSTPNILFGLTSQFSKFPILKTILQAVTFLESFCINLTSSQILNNFLPSK
jgi:hypothetical protein